MSSSEKSTSAAVSRRACRERRPDGRAHSDSAPEAYENTLAIDSTDYRVWGNLASCLSLLPDREEEKRRAYEKAALLAEERRRRDPRNARLLTHIAGYYDALGDPESALPLVEEAIVLAPDDVEVMFHAAHAYERLGRRENALEWVGRAVRNGYSLSLIEETPGLRELTADPRYREIVRKVSGKGAP